MTSSPLFRLAGLFRPGMDRAARMNDHLIWEDTFGRSLEDLSIDSMLSRSSNGTSRRSSAASQ
jgi:hypothetical protein